MVDLVKGQKHDKVLNVTINFLNTGIMRCLYDYFMSSRDFHKRLDLAERFFKCLLQSKLSTILDAVLQFVHSESTHDLLIFARIFKNY